VRDTTVWLEHVNTTVVMLNALSLTYPDKDDPDATILRAAAAIASKRASYLLGLPEPEREGRKLRAVEDRSD